MAQADKEKPLATANMASKIACGFEADRCVWAIDG
jgi:hypothetical protein